MLVKINDTDITKYILASSYKVNSYPIYTEWTDANYVRHRELHRYQVKGSFEMKFPSDGGTEYENFVHLLKNNSVGDSAVLFVYVNNICESKSVDAFYEMRPIIKKAAQGRNFESFVFNLEEK